MEIGTMNRNETIIKIDDAAYLLEKAAAALNIMGATHSMVSRVENLVRQLDDLRVDVAMCDLPNEGE
jgi:DNA-binding NtrC family response regulator